MKIVDGNKACASMAYMFSEVTPIYPITPSSPMGSSIDKMTNENIENIFGDQVSVIEMQSEAGAIGAMHGALLSGNLSSTFTSSQGLLLMIPNMYKIAGEMLPGVIHVASRALATHALSIFGDHSDVYAARNTGFCFLASSSVQDAYNMALIAHISALKGHLPFVHFFDGFRTSHELNTIKELDKKEIEKLVPKNEIEIFRSQSMFGNKCYQRGLAQNEDVYFQFSEARNSEYLNMPDVVAEVMKDANKVLGTNYKPFNYYGQPYATKLIVAMGSVNDTIKLVVDDLNNKGDKVGLLMVNLFRPFSSKYFQNEIPASVSRIVVLDRAKDATMGGEALYLDVLNALKDKNVEIVGGRYGLSSKNTTPAMIKAVFDMMEKDLINNFTIGIDDDVTNLSLDIDEEYSINLNLNEVRIFGFGSDGMVSTSKDILTILGEKENLFVQGYFEYDSKKSNGLTISHLRYGKKEIKAPFYPTNPKLVVITKEEYVNRYSMLDGIEEYGTVVLNTSKTKEELNDFLPDEFKEIILKKNIKFYIIDASKIALDAGIKGKISKIMEAIILNILNVPNYEATLIESINKQFKTKGEAVINSNVNALKSAITNLLFVDTQLTINNNKLKQDNSIVGRINSRRGISLKVSEIIELKDGRFPCATSKYEKNKNSLMVPKWDKEKCIQCNQCSIICPHAVIRPFTLDKDNKYVPVAKEMITDKEVFYLMSVSEADCTGCGLCIKTCPRDALSLGEYDDEKQNIANDLFNNYENKITGDVFNIKNSQFKKPLFEFSSACAGCGETPYIKLLTQLFGERLAIANATGCSSIYGGSMPSTPYQIPWANSLFEDNAEFGYGLLLGYLNTKKRIKKLMETNLNSCEVNVKEEYTKWLANSNDYDVTLQVKNNLSNMNIPFELKELLSYIPSRSIWTIGGDGWAYDIGYGGIDHVLASNDDVNILVLDTEVYSNTGGQASKSSHIGQVCEFANFGKRTYKKDLFKKAMTYPGVYVASVCLGANPMQTIKAMKEAEAHHGPSIIIAYAPCVNHGIKGSMSCVLEEEKLAVTAGYVLLMRYMEGKLYLDSQEPDFNKYPEFLNNEVRYNALKIKDSQMYEKLISLQIENAKKRYNEYLEMSQK